MHFVVRHETVYRYSVPVRLAPHLLRLTPRPDAVQNASSVLLLEPQTSARRERSDPFGNRLTEVEFAGWTQLLRIECQLQLDTFSPIPLSSFGSWPRLPWPFGARDGLEIYRSSFDVDPTVQQFARELAIQVQSEPVAFLDCLTRTLCDRTDQQVRVAGSAQPAASTLASWQGTCRDLTVLFMAACRSQGIASRFVSGYLAPVDRFDAARQLHAWPEVFLPGIGWRGWDPSQGERVLDAHVPLCAAPSQSETMPVEGGFYFDGATVTSTLGFDLRISTSWG
jgi:transglutaminase-like putative cysteine protease